MAIRVDATGDALGRSSGLPSNTAFTFSGWSRIISNLGTTTIQPVIFALDAGATDGWSLLWNEGVGDSAMRLYSYDAGAIYDGGAFASRPAVGADFFWYIKCGANGTNTVEAGWKLATDPTFVTAQVNMNAVIAQVANLYLGGVLSAYYANKRVWNVKGWDRELSQAELHVECMFERVMFPANAHAHWRLRNVSDVVDRSGNGRTLTTGGTLTAEDELSLWRPSRRAMLFGAAGGVTLTVASATHSNVVDVLVLTQVNLLAVAEAVHGNAVDGVGLVPGYSLTVADALHGNAIESVALLQANMLAVSDTVHANASDNVALVQKSVLAVSDGIHANAADAVALLQGYLLTVAGATHGNAADSPLLSVAISLSVAGASHGNTAEAVALLQKSILAVAETIHGHAVESVNLQIAGNLGVQSAIHANQADNVSLLQASILDVSGAIHTHSVVNIALSNSVQLAVADALHANAADSVQLTPAHVLAVASALHLHAADAISLSESAVLIVSDTLHAHLAGVLTIGEPDISLSPGRIIVVKARSRVIVVTPRSRTIRVIH